jgi:hypothetical protein
MSLEYAAARAAEISVLQCGQMQTATRHPSIETPNNKQILSQRKGNGSSRPSTYTDHFMDAHPAGFDSLTKRAHPFHNFLVG